MASFGDILTHDAAVDLIKSGDTDGDGFLNFVEFTVVLRDILLEWFLNTFAYPQHNSANRSHFNWLLDWNKKNAITIEMTMLRWC